MTPEPGSAAPAGGQELSDLSALKALAQPRRQQILQHLTLHGPATSAMLARDLGLNTGATSYHLRELARYGFAEESSTQGRSVGGRERWWRAVPGDRRFPPRSRQNIETRLVMDELNHLSYAADLELFEQLQRQGQDLGEWADAFPYSRGTIRLTLPELRTFFEEFIALLNRYTRPDSETPDGARTVLTRLLAFPAPTRADGTRADDTCADGTRAGDASVHQASAHRAAAGDAPAGQAPAHRAAAGDATVHQVPVGDASVRPASVRQVTVGDVRAHQAPARQVPVGDAPVHHAPARRAPVDDAQAHHAPARQVPVGDAPVHHAPARRAPVDDAQAHHAPARQVPVGDAPVHHAPARRAPADDAHARQVSAGDAPAHRAAPADKSQASAEGIPASRTTTETDTP
ncbi:helix-turn-helix domain-containing protein [Streptomyces sp. NBC_00569]|uniref:helix-turn-helix domain-containing protein n=1 Tax=Streptomyces sp. NBC_00569 TaxID=2975780 RepID=UPI002E8145C2|nr:helix-turn-helix domain-containing protein [Streptomyces sp. NBC_00569]WUB93514.1 helix-turn-helix domain-containing protein [Streptomyces sp. NBC_00569]